MDPSLSEQMLNVTYLLYNQKLNFKHLQYRIIVHLSATCIISCITHEHIIWFVSLGWFSSNDFFPVYLCKLPSCSFHYFMWTAQSTVTTCVTYHWNIINIIIFLNVFILVFCLDDLLIVKNGKLKSPDVIVYFSFQIY